MLVQAGGQERTQEEYEALMKSAGLILKSRFLNPFGRDVMFFGFEP
jgi:hypothetical protein